MLAKCGSEDGAVVSSDAVPELAPFTCLILLHVASTPHFPLSWSMSPGTLWFASGCIIIVVEEDMTEAGERVHGLRDGECLGAVEVILVNGT